MSRRAQIVDLRPYKEERFSYRKLTGTVLIVTATIMLIVSSVPYMSLAFEGDSPTITKELPQAGETLRGARTPAVAGTTSTATTQPQQEPTIVQENASIQEILNQNPIHFDASETELVSTLTEQQQAEESGEEPVQPNDDIGHLYINGAEVRVDAPITEGVEAGNFLNGVGHQPGTALPGQNGNLVIAGHRWLPTKESPYARIFQELPKLQVGETIEVAAADGTLYTYEVSSTEIVDPTEVRILDETDGPELTIYTCHPLTSTKYRYVVHSKLIDVQ